MSDIQIPAGTTDNAIVFYNPNTAQLDFDSDVRLDVPGCTIATVNETGDDICHHQIGTNGPVSLILRKSLGTEGSLLPLTNGTKIGGFAFVGDDGVVPGAGSPGYTGAEIQAFTLGDQSATNGGASLRFRATAEDTKVATLVYQTKSNAENEFLTNVDVTGAIYKQDNIPIMDGVSRIVNNTSDVTFNYNLITPTVVTFSNISDPTINGTEVFSSTNQTITTNYTGKVEVSAEVSTFSSGQRVALRSSITKNGVEIGANQYSYIRAVSGHNRDTMNPRVNISCVPGDVFRVVIARRGTITTPTTLGARASFSAKRTA